jgi:hypothetical protein
MRNGGSNHDVDFGVFPVCGVEEMMITPREAELLSYLQGCGPVGTWVFPEPRHMRDDLGFMSRYSIWRRVEGLRDCGAIETRKAAWNARLHEFRVLVRVERLEIGYQPAGRAAVSHWLEHHA